MPSQSFQKGKDLYWNWLKSQKKSINGRDVEVVFRNDNYNPSQAVQACREMVEQEKVFLLVGIAGTDQIQACARYAASAGVPYLSAGVTEIGLTGLRNYFALWRSYPEQGPLLADLLVSKLGAREEKNGMLRFNTPTFQDGHDTFIKAMDGCWSRRRIRPSDLEDGRRKRGTDHRDRAEPARDRERPRPRLPHLLHPAGAGGSEPAVPPAVGGLRADEGTRHRGQRRVPQQPVDPERTIPQSRSPHTSTPTSSTPTSAKPAEPTTSCSGCGGRRRSSPTCCINGGQNLTRESFILNNEKDSSIKTGVNPDVSFSPNDHFGGTSMHLLRADCPNNRYVTEKAFATSF